MRKLRIVPVLALALAACSQEAEPEAGGENLEAKGEILGGTISDDMLPLESVTSQSPPLAGQDSEQTGAEASDAEEPVEAAPAVLPVETPEVTPPSLPDPVPADPS